ncbi:hypothetical protein LXL04_006106 [Taraxacum kok-saghyz]
MEEIHGDHSSYPKDLPWQELKAKVPGVDESIFENKGIVIGDHDAKEDTGAGSGSGSYNLQSKDDLQSNQLSNDDDRMKIKKPENDPPKPLPLPHEQVPQPDYFPTEALEQL